MQRAKILSYPTFSRLQLEEEGVEEVLGPVQVFWGTFSALDSGRSE